MSKTYLNYLEKAFALVEGLKKNHETVKGHGISMEQVAKLEQAIKDGSLLNAEVERLRAAASEKTAEANVKLAEVKDLMSDFKHIIKRDFDISQWEQFGVADKR